MLYVITYDITHPKRLYRVAKELEGWGYRVQDSVFECWLEPTDLTRLQQRLARRIHPATDKIYYYPLCGKDVAQVRFDGPGSPPASPPGWVI
jgi:CRISPR-associated protein Cas2